MTGVARKRRRTQHKVHYYGSDDVDSNTGPVEQRHLHTSFVSRSTGLSTRTSYVSATNLATSNRIQDDSGFHTDSDAELVSRVEGDEDPLQTDEEAFETLDPNSFMDFSDYVEERKRRKHTAGVSGY